MFQRLGDDTLHELLHDLKDLDRQELRADRATREGWHDVQDIKATLRNKFQGE